MTVAELHRYPVKSMLGESLSRARIGPTGVVGDRAYALIDVETGKVIEFVDPELEQLQKAIAERLGFRLVDHRMELYGVVLDRKG